MTTRLQELVFLSLDKIHEIALHAGARDAALALSAIKTLVAAVQLARTEHITLDELENLIAREEKRLADKLAENKKIIAGEIDKKFPT